MSPVLNSSPSSIYETLDNFVDVSGSSIVTSSDFEIVEIHSSADIVSSFRPVSSFLLCMMIIALFFYHKFLCLCKHFLLFLFGGTK